MKRPPKSSLTTQYIILFGVLLLAANVVLGFLLLRQSSSMVQSLIRKNMLDISNTAADLIDGDVIGAFTEADVGSPAYNDILNNLAAFQNNVDIKYIYAVRQTGEDVFVFTVDPDPVDPGLFGEEVLVTAAMREAGKGTAAVDDAPAEDRWGNYYSSFSPIFDTQGNVAGIVGIDFNSEWYNRQVWKNTSFVLFISVLFAMVGVSCFLLVNSRVHRRFEELKAELNTLSGDVKTLTAEILSSAGYGEQPARMRDGAETDTGDELQALGRNLRSMHREMERYLNFMHAQVNTDALTRVGNTSAYMERQKETEAKIQDGSAAFSAVVFDINDLKHVNDRYGHACGDRIIRAAASVIAGSFGKEHTYRIGGDEFIAIAEQMTAETLAERMAEIDRAVAAYNAANPDYGAVLSLSSGQADYRPGQDTSFRDVFVRADSQMYACKERYHTGRKHPADVHPVPVP